MTRHFLACVGERIEVRRHTRLLQALQRHEAAVARAALQGDIESAAEYIVTTAKLPTADTASSSPVQDKPETVRISRKEPPLTK